MDSGLRQRGTNRSGPRPEIGPVADTIALYKAVQRMRPVPVGKTSLLAIALPVVIPFIGVLAIRIPLKQLPGQLAKGLL